jgi:SAM-dependent methyltransferase
VSDDLGERVRTLTRNYNDESEVYERAWAPVLRELAIPVLERLPADATALLDVAAGTGAVLDELRERHPTATIVGLDRSEGMIRRAGRSHARAVADAQQLPFHEDSFDAATMFFALFHMADPAGALKQLRRVLRSGGTVGVSTWADQEEWRQMDLWHELLTEHGAPPPESVLSRHELTDRPEKVEGLLREGGFEDVSAWTHTFERHWDTDGFLDFVTGMALPKRRLDSLPEQVRPAFVEEARAALERLPESARIHRPVVVFGLGRV